MSWLQQFLSRRQHGQELSEEIRAHLEEKADELVAGGMSRKEALLTARREFGNVGLTEERGRDVWRWAPVEDFFSDVRYALRQLRQSPVFALASVLTLALGIGANTAVFSIVDAVILRPLPYLDPDRLVTVQLRNARGTPRPERFCYPTFFDFRDSNQVFEHLVSYRGEEFTLTGFGQPTQLRGAIVSADLFPMLGVQPALGRGFSRNEEDAGQRVVVLGHGLWRGQFGGDPAVVGRTITLDRQPYTVVGVAPQGFRFPAANDSVQIWATLAVDAASATIQPLTKQRGSRILAAFARLKPGVSVEQAQVQVDGVAAAIARQHPNHNRNLASTYVRPALTTLIGETGEPVLILLAAVGLVLLIACANIANLLLARTAEREQEFALRAAIGAGRGRIVRQLVTESLTLALAGCVAGLLAAKAAIGLALPLAGDSIPRIQQASVDGRVLGFSIVLAILTSVLFSLAPALRLARVELTRPLKEGARSTTDGAGRLRSALVVAQIALGLTLLSCAGLLAASFLYLINRDSGLTRDGVVTFRVSLPSAEYPRERQLEFSDRLLERLSQLPGTKSAAAAMPLPLTGSLMAVSFQIEGRPTPPSERPRSAVTIVTPGFFRTLGVPLREGREFSERDDVKAPPVLIVNRAFADRFFPGASALGRRIEPGATSDRGGTKKREIVGIVGNTSQSPLSRDAEPVYYFPYAQLPWCCPSILVRTAAPTAIESSIRGVVASLDKQLPVNDVRTLAEIQTMGLAAPRFHLLLLGSFAAIALLLTLVGLYGVLAYSVVRRTQEIGLRIALGASRETVLAMVFRKAMTLVALGVSIGLAGAFAGGQIMSKMLYGVGPRSPLLLGLACVVVALTAALAAYLPARRAASIDPMQALRSE